MHSSAHSPELCRCGQSRVWGFWRTPHLFLPWEPPSNIYQLPVLSLPECVLEAQHPEVCSRMGLRAWVFRGMASLEAEHNFLLPSRPAPCGGHRLAHMDQRGEMPEVLTACVGMRVGRSGPWVLWQEAACVRALCKPQLCSDTEESSHRESIWRESECSRPREQQKQSREVWGVGFITEWRWGWK